MLLQSGIKVSFLRLKDCDKSFSARCRVGLVNPETQHRRPLRRITKASSSSKGGNSARNPQKAYRISSVGQSVLDTLVDVEVGCGSCLPSSVAFLWTISAKVPAIHDACITHNRNTCELLAADDHAHHRGQGLGTAGGRDMAQPAAVLPQRPGADPEAAAVRRRQRCSIPGTRSARRAMAQAPLVCAAQFDLRQRTLISTDCSLPDSLTCHLRHWRQ